MSASPIPGQSTEKDILDVVLQQPTARHYQLAAQALEALPSVHRRGRPVRFALLSTANYDVLRPYLSVELTAAGFVPQLYFGPFGQIGQEVLDGASALWAFRPDVVMLAARTGDLLAPLWDEYDPQEASSATARALETLQSLARQLSRQGVRVVLLANLETPARPPEGLLDHQRVDGAVAAIRAANRALETWAASEAGVVLFDSEGMSARFGKSRWTDARLWHLGRIPLSRAALPEMAREIARYTRAALAGAAKCLVLDLDYTLWGGVLGEEGLRGISLGHTYPGSAYRALQQECLNLQKRGILLAVNSKNNMEDVREAFTQHPEMLLKLEHFSAMAVNWKDKAENMQSLARELNLGLDSFVFLDDSPAERERVRSAFPEIAVPDLPGEPAEYANFLRSLPFFEQVSLSAEDRQRHAMYRAEALRKEAAALSGSLDEFLASLEMRLTVGRPSAAHVERIAQLTQKTNQFNLTTRRYTPQAIEELRANPACRIYRAHLRDRFGDSGLIGVAIVKIQRSTWEIDTFLLSCRVLGRQVETALLATICAEAKAARAKELVGRYIKSKRNAVAAEFYAQHGFHLRGKAATDVDDEAEWVLTLDGDTLPEMPAVLELVSE